MNKKELVMSMLKGNEPRMLMGYVTNVKTEVDDRMPKFGDYYSGPVFGKEGRRADLKVTLEFVFFTEDDEGIKEAHDFLDDIKLEQGKAHAKMPFMIMRTE